MKKQQNENNRKKRNMAGVFLRSFFLVLAIFLILIGIFGLAVMYIFGVFDPAPIKETETVSEEYEVDLGPDTYYYKNEEDVQLLSAYQELNPDVVGIIRILDTVLNHPVVYTPEDDDYYLSRDLYGDYNSHGVPFLSAASDFEGFGGNSVIYGHNIHIKEPDVFGELPNYEDIAYYKEHPYIETVSEKGNRKWVIVAYFIVDNADENPFRYSDYTDFLSERKFNEFFREVNLRNWISSDIPLNIGDTFLTLSSCSNELALSGTNRMVVIAKLLANGEDVSSYVENAVQAEAPLLPERLRGVR